MLNLFEGFSFASLKVVDYVLLGIVLIFMIVGAKRGFMDQLFGIIGTFGAIVGAVLLCKVVGNMLPTDGFIFNKVSGFIDGKFAGESATLYNTPTDFSNPENVSLALSAMGLSFLEFLLKSVFAGFSPNGEQVKLSEVLPLEATRLVNCAIAFIVLLVVLAIVISIVKKIVLKFVKLPGIKALDKLLGFVLGAGFAVIIIVGVCLLAGFLGGVVPVVGDFIETKIYEGCFLGQYIRQLVQWVSGYLV